MSKIEYDDLSDEVQKQIAQLEIDVMDLKFEANFYRAATLIVFVISIERLWERFFS